jgi:hypothetical protein
MRFFIDAPLVTVVDPPELVATSGSLPHHGEPDASAFSAAGRPKKTEEVLTIDILTIET